MKIKLVMRDQAFCKALAERMANAGPDIFIEIGKDFTTDRSKILVTDVGDGKLLPGMVFLSADPSRHVVEGSGPYALYKYKPVKELIGDLAICFYQFSGIGIQKETPGFRLAFASLGPSAVSEALSLMVARQISYSYGLRVLWMPLTCLQWQTNEQHGTERTLRKMIYYMQSGRNFPVDAFFYKDTNDIYQFRIPDGFNELTWIPSGEICRLTAGLSHLFPCIILHFGDNFSEQNLKLIKESSVFCCTSERADIYRIQELFGTESVVPIGTDEISPMRAQELAELLVQKDGRI